MLTPTARLRESQLLLWLFTGGRLGECTRAGWIPALAGPCLVRSVEDPSGKRYQVNVFPWPRTRVVLSWDGERQEGHFGGTVDDVLEYYDDILTLLEAVGQKGGTPVLRDLWDLPEASEFSGHGAAWSSSPESPETIPELPEEAWEPVPQLSLFAGDCGPPVYRHLDEVSDGLVGGACGDSVRGPGRIP